MVVRLTTRVVLRAARDVKDVAYNREIDALVRDTIKRGELGSREELVRFAREFWEERQRAEHNDHDGDGEVGAGRHQHQGSFSFSFKVSTVSNGAVAHSWYRGDIAAMATAGSRVNPRESAAPRWISGGSPGAC